MAARSVDSTASARGEFPAHKFEARLKKKTANTATERGCGGRLSRSQFAKLLRLVLRTPPRSDALEIFRGITPWLNRKRLKQVVHLAFAVGERIQVHADLVQPGQVD